MFYTLYKAGALYDKHYSEHAKRDVTIESQVENKCFK